ncbi:MULTISPECIES: addiction module protein [Asticcacaulis]|uniref:addiction module protein n=1 Tax=Asticcacaulis TaxID=76890 RepID=UPI001AEA5113|nr:MULTISPECIES: addiction module protein [Asticcacaulis]MBP2160654.1 putative addiction module component (TIGR02574 family) [Asticcacaulis solisilvae]MDR6801699.1 putative addiction module component (TIGR02574 family) [Asticcacaulis sp. BE141]
MGILTPEEINQLTVAERLELIGELWDSIENKDIPLTPAQLAELDRRIATFDEDIKEAVSWDDLKVELIARAP